MDIEEVAADLYGAPPEEFTAARNAAAKMARDSGDRELGSAIAALRKPTAAAWLLNRLARTNSAEVDGLLELGVRLRAAQGTLGAAELRALDTERRALTRALAARAAGAAGGRRVSASVLAQVEESLRSAMVDADAGRALASGLLVDAFSSTGLEPVDLSRVVALPDAHPVRGRGDGEPAGERAADRQPDPAAVAAARAAAEAAASALDAARAAAARAAQTAVEARRRREDLESELAEARRRVEELQRRMDVASAAEVDTRRDQVSATRDERAAVDAAQRARRDLDSLTGEHD